MQEFDPKALVADLQNISNEKFNPDIHHVIAVLNILGDNDFKMVGNVDAYIATINRDKDLTINDFTFRHDSLTNIWFSWDVEDGIVTAGEGETPFDVHEGSTVELDINDMLDAAINDELISWISEVVGESAIEEDRSWAELIDVLQELEIHSQEEDVFELATFVNAIQEKMLSRR